MSTKRTFKKSRMDAEFWIYWVVIKDQRSTLLFDSWSDILEWIKAEDSRGRQHMISIFALTRHNELALVEPSRVVYAIWMS